MHPPQWTTPQRQASAGRTGTTAVYVHAHEHTQPHRATRAQHCIISLSQEKRETKTQRAMVLALA